MDDRWRGSKQRKKNTEQRKLKRKKENQRDTENGERGCFLSVQEGIEQESVAESDRAKAERKTDSSHQLPDLHLLERE